MTKNCTCPDLLNGHHFNCPYLKIESDSCHCDCCDLERDEGETLVLTNPENKIRFPDPNINNVFLPAHLVARLYLDSLPTGRKAYSHTSANYIIVTGGEAQFGFEIYSDQSTIPFTPCYSFSDTFIKEFRIKAFEHRWNVTFLTDYEQLEKDQGNNNLVTFGNLPPQPRQRFYREKEVPQFFHAGVLLSSRIQKEKTNEF